MGVGSNLLELGRVLDDFERRRAVERVDVADFRGTDSSGRVTADVELRLSTCPAASDGQAVSLVGTTIGADGEIRFTFETVDGIVPEGADRVDFELSEVGVDQDGSVTLTLTVSTRLSEAVGTGSSEAAGGTRAEADDESRVAGDGGGSDAAGSTGHSGDGTGAGLSVTAVEEPDDRTAVEPDSGRHAGDIPPFEDPDLLRDVYESCETFAEMRDALEMDVTAETVRRYMISHGIHDPNSYDTTAEDGTGIESLGAEADAETPDIVADGIGLPEDVTVENLVETVRRSNTIYEVTREFGIDREEALEMLRQLDLVEHVVGRLAKKDEREVSRELVVERLRRHAEPG